jgi:enoyl-CoA hydratase
MSETEVLIERLDAVLVITLNRPEARNAINGSMSRAICAAIDELEAEPALRAGVLTGSGRAFSAGMDLKAFLTGDLPDIPGRGMGGITTTPPQKPLIAAVEGWAVAGGLELMLACDLVVAGRSARFGVPEVKRSLIPDGGGALRLPRRIPYAVALEMLLTGDPIDAARAAAIGLVNHVVDDGDARDTAVALAARIAANGPLAVAATKEIARRSVGWDEAEAFELQEPISRSVYESADAREGASAFAEKREPRWRGE